MHGELREIFDFLKSVRPFDELPDAVLQKLCHKLVIRYFKRQSQILCAGENNRYLYILCTGAVDIHNPDGVFISRLYERECFGYISLIKQQQASNQVVAYEDSLAYMLDGESFNQLCDSCDDFRDYFLLAEAERLRKAIRHLRNESIQPGSRLLLPVSGGLKRKPVTSSDGITVHEAAALMAREHVSTIMIVDQAGQLTGIVTDKDLRNRVLAPGVDPASAVKTIMTENPFTIEEKSTVFEARLLMMRHNIHHLPVVRDGRPVGMITITDILKLANQSPVYTIAGIHKAADVRELVDISTMLPELLTQLVDTGLYAHQVGQIISTIGEHINIHLLEMAEAELGPPPVDYAWLAAGSQGRREQLLHSDQDNALLLGNEYSEAEHGDYFRNLCTRVSDGLNQCGYVYCPGNIMATNPEWRQPLDTWKRYFSEWINTPNPAALLNSSIFFDMRPLHGNPALFDELQSAYLDQARANSLFTAHLFTNARKFSPPLGFFRRLVLISDKEHSHHLDLKTNGTGPIVDIARAYSLSAGIKVVNTHSRIIQAGKQGAMSTKSADNLLDAYEFINLFRMKHQARQILAHIEPDNFADPDQLSSFDRDHLRDAFRIVADIQQDLAIQYPVRQ